MSITVDGAASLTATKVDSREGIQFLVDWARGNRIVLNEAHEAIAKRHGVSTTGVIINRPMSIEDIRREMARPDVLIRAD